MSGYNGSSGYSGYSGYAPYAPQFSPQPTPISPNNPISSFTNNIVINKPVDYYPVSQKQPGLVPVVQSPVQAQTVVQVPGYIPTQQAPTQLVYNQGNVQPTAPPQLGYAQYTLQSENSGYIETGCRDISFPWPVAIIVLIGGSFVIYSAVASVVSSARRTFVALMMLLWTAVWALLLWLLWSRCYNSLAWWMMIIPIAMMLLFFILLIALNLE